MIIVLHFLRLMCQAQRRKVGMARATTTKFSLERSQMVGCVQRSDQKQKKLRSKSTTLFVSARAIYAQLCAADTAFTCWRTSGSRKNWTALATHRRLRRQMTRTSTTTATTMRRF